MSAIAEAPPIALRAPNRPRSASALLTLARRRASLTSRTPRQILVPLLGPALLALVVAPALKVATGGLHSHIDYSSFVGVGAVGLVVPLSCIFAGLSVIVDRDSGAQRKLLAGSGPARVPGARQPHRGAGLPAPPGDGADRAVGAAGCVVPGDRERPGVVRGGGAAVHGVHVRGRRDARERISKQEEYIGATPAVAILPFFLAGALYPISAMPSALATIAKLLPLTHALALLRWALVDPSGRGLHEIWGMSNVTAEAWLSLAVLAAFAGLLTIVSIRVFSRSAVR